MMFEILSQAQQTITAVPLDPKEMTALIQQINDMYSSSFDKYLGWIGFFLALIAVLFGIIQILQVQWRNKEIDMASQKLQEIESRISPLLTSQETLAKDMGLLKNEQKNAQKQINIEVGRMRGQIDYINNNFFPAIAHFCTSTNVLMDYYEFNKNESEYAFSMAASNLNHLIMACEKFLKFQPDSNSKLLAATTIQRMISNVKKHMNNIPAIDGYIQGLARYADQMVMAKKGTK